MTKAALVSAVVAIGLMTAIAAAAANGTDQANAARACTALRAANVSAFAAQYASFGACTSKWA